jgi:hypothetical protein
MPTCPECGAEGVPIVYGMPGSELIAEEEAGQVVLGGCVVGEENPTWACKGPDQHEWVPEVASMQVADLLHEALRIGDDGGLTQIRGRHLPEGLMAALVKQTHEYALAHAAAGTPDGWLVYRDGIEPWWRKAGDLTNHDCARMFHLRTDVVKQLAEQGLADRRHPRSTLLYVRRTAA